MEFMETLNFSIDSKKRNPLSKGQEFRTVWLEYYSCISESSICNESLSMFTIIIILSGIYSIIYGLIGKELLMIHYYLIMDFKSNKV